jgi:hypothetical protein
MTRHNRRGFIDLLVCHTIVSTKEPAEVIDQSALRIDGVLSNGGVVFVSGGVEYDDGVVAAVTFETSACHGV